MDLAALEIKLSADFAAGFPAINKLVQGLDNITLASAKSNAALDLSARSLARFTALTAGTSGGMKLIADNSSKAATSIANTTEEIEDSEKSIQDFASRFSSAMNAAIESASKFPTPLLEASEAAGELSDKLDTLKNKNIVITDEGTEKIINDTKLIDDNLKLIPDVITTSFTLSGNTQSALAELGSLSAEINELGNGGAASIAKINLALAQLRTASANATNVQEIQKYDAAINLLKADLSNIEGVVKKSGVSLSNIGLGSNSATLALQNLGRVAQDLPYGFIGISNNLNPLLESFQRLASESKAAGTSIVSVLTKSLTGAGGLGLALSVVTAAFSFASFGLQFWTRGMGQSKKAVDEAAKANEDYQKSLKSISDSAIKDAEKQITDFTELTIRVKDNTISLNERLAAAGKLQEQSGYFAALSKEQILYGDITNAINETTQALLNNAYASAATSKAAEAGARVYDIDLKRRDALVKLTQAQIAFDDANKKGLLTITAGTSSFGSSVTTQNPVVQQLKNAKDLVNVLTGQFAEAQLEQASFLADAEKYKNLSSNIDQASIILAKLNNEIDVLNKKSLATGANFNTEKINDYKKAVEDLLALPNITTSDARVQNLIAQIKALGGSFDEAARKRKQTISDVLNDLDKELSFLDQKHIELGVDVNPDKINAILSTIKKLESDFNVKPDSTIISKLFGDISVLKLPQTLEQLKNFANKLKIPETPVKAPITIEPKVTTIEDFNLIVERQILENTGKLFKNSQGIKVPVKLLNDFEVDKNFKDLKAKLADQAEQISEIAANSISDLLSNISEGIGTLIGGGGNIFGGIFEILGKGLEDLGKYVIASSALIGNIKEVLNKIIAVSGGQVLGIALGLSLEVLGAAILAKAPKLAGGGIVPPGYPGDTYPAWLSSNEAVIPLDKMHQYIEPSSQRIELVVSGTLEGQGDKMLAIINRAQRKRDRTY